LYAAIKNYCLNRLRAEKINRKRKLWYESTFVDNQIMSPIETKELGLQIHQAMENLPAGKKQSFHMQYIEGRSQQEIAEIKGVNVQTVKNQVFSALKELRCSLKNL